MKFKWQCNECSTHIELNQKPTVIEINKKKIEEYKLKLVKYGRDKKKYDRYQTSKTKAEIKYKTYTQEFKKRQSVFWNRDKMLSFDDFFKKLYPRTKRRGYPSIPEKPTEKVGIRCPVCGNHRIITRYSLSKG